MVYDEPKRWADFVPLVLWACHTSKHTSTQATPFTLVYGVEVIVPFDVMLLLACLVLVSKVSDSNGRFYVVEALEEKRRSAESK